MSAIARVSLPQEFFDITSPKMLIQPEPDYLYARLVFMAFAQAQLQRGAISIGISADRGVPTHGAPVPQLEEMQLFLTDTLRSGAVLVDDSVFGSGPGIVGHTVRFNRPAFSGGGYTAAARTIAANTSISTTGITVSSEQVALTAVLVGGPYDSVNSRVAPYEVFGFDAGRSVHSFAERVGLDLARDRMKYIDSVFATLFTQGSSVVYPGNPNSQSLTVDTAFTVAGNRGMDVETIYRAEATLQAANIPRFPTGKYIMVLAPNAVRQLRSDPEFRDIGKEDVANSPLKASFIATVGSTEVYVSNTVPTATNSSSVTYYKNQIFGPGGVGYLPAMQCHTRSANEDNYGFNPKVIWSAAEGQDVLDNRFMASIFTD